MAEEYSATTLLSVVRESLLEIGYHNDLLQENYGFVDVLAQDQPLRSIELAAFAQEPPSYRNACFGVVVPPHDGPEAIMDYRALGAPQILSLAPETNVIRRWKMLAYGKPVLLDSIEPAHLRNAIWSHRAEWSPEQVLRAKSIRFTNDSLQLDFFDAGLVPALEELVQEKLDRLLREVIAACKAAYKERHEQELDYKALFRLVFRLLAAKLLGDREYPGNWLSSNTQQVIKEVEDFYFQHIPPEAVLDDIPVQDLAWRKIRTAFSFRNLSVEALSYVYENTLVSPETRRRYGTHATPPQIAEYIVQNLPFEELASEERHVFEPFCGHAPFLTAALGRLRALLPPDVSAIQRHEYFVQMLSGMELDSFACEVARNRLILADYPNPNGWRIENADVFASSKLSDYLAQIVLCNPPYEDFTFEERSANPSVHAANKAVEALQRVLRQPPKMLGFVLPRLFAGGPSYRDLRQAITSLYNNVTLVELPDIAFNYSEAETMLLIAHGQRTTQPQRRSVFVEKKDYQRFLYTGEPTSQIDIPTDLTLEEADTQLWHNRLQAVWDALAHLPHLGDIAEIHRGIEYNIPFKQNETVLVSDMPRAEFVKGLLRITEDFEPYVVQSFSYLNAGPGKRRHNAYELPWEKPKVIANAARLSRGPWTIAAAIDEQGLVCYQNFHGIWPLDNVPLEVIAALLNGPIANAFLSTHQASRHNKLQTMKQIPIPKLDLIDAPLIVALVREYISCRAQWREQSEDTEYHEKRCRGIMKQLEGELLRTYDLPLQIERDLVQYIDGYRRPGPVSLTQVKLSPTKRLYTSLIRVEDVRNEGGNKMIDAVITNWDPHQTVHFPFSLIPVNLQEKIDRDVRLLAKVNIGARRVEDLILEDIRLAPELDPEDELA